MPTLTVNIASRGTQLSSGGTSAVGHMYYVISNGTSEALSFGFAPKEHGDAFGEGKVYDNDASEYITSDFSTTFEITQQQFDKLKDFGENYGDYGFDGNYDGLDNSCIDLLGKL